MFERSLSTNICLLRLVGAWPQVYLSRFGNYAYLAFIISFFLIPVSYFPLLYIYLSDNVDLVRISQTAFMSCELMLIAPKLIIVLVNHRKLKAVVRYWDIKHFYSLPPLGSKEIIFKTTKQAKEICRWFSCLCAFGAITWAAKPLQNLSCRMLPADMWLPFDPFKDNIRFALTYCHSFLGKIWLIWIIFEMNSHIKPYFNSIPRSWPCTLKESSFGCTHTND